MLIHCQNCDKPMSDGARRCTHCNAEPPVGHRVCKQCRSKIPPSWWEGRGSWYSPKGWHWPGAPGVHQDITKAHCPECGHPELEHIPWDRKVEPEREG